MTSKRPDCTWCSKTIRTEGEQRSLGTNASGSPRYIKYHLDCYADYQLDYRHRIARERQAFLAILELDTDEAIVSAVRELQVTR